MLALVCVIPLARTDSPDQEIMRDEGYMLSSLVGLVLGIVTLCPAAALAGSLRARTTSQAFAAFLFGFFLGALTSVAAGVELISTRAGFSALAITVGGGMAVSFVIAWVIARSDPASEKKEPGPSGEPRDDRPAAKGGRPEVPDE
jgi:hypothetical protein